MSKYYVTVDIFFMDYVEVEAEDEEDAKKQAINSARQYGMGEEVTIHAIEEIE